MTVDSGDMQDYLAVYRRAQRERERAVQASKVLLRKAADGQATGEDYQVATNAALDGLTAAWDFIAATVAVSERESERARQAQATEGGA